MKLPRRNFLHLAAGAAALPRVTSCREHARDGVELEVRNAAGAVEDLNLLRDDASGVQAALTALGFTRTGVVRCMSSVR